MLPRKVCCYRFREEPVNDTLLIKPFHVAAGERQNFTIFCAFPIYPYSSTLAQSIITLVIYNLQ